MTNNRFTHNLELEAGQGEKRTMDVKSSMDFEELEKFLERVHTVRVD